jgi:hypothetical protein
VPGREPIPPPSKGFDLVAAHNLIKENDWIKRPNDEFFTSTRIEIAKRRFLSKNA